jgi:hypothetical protein
VRAVRDSDDVARGLGPPWFRAALVVLAIAYYLTLSLVDHARRITPPRIVAFFTQATQLFMSSDANVIEFHLEGWSCPRQRWEPMDPRPYFRVHADDKESRFQRVAYFYELDPGKKGKWMRPVMRAMERYLIEQHAAGGADDGVDGPIGGIHIFKTLTPIPDPEWAIDRYEYRPLDKIAEKDQVELFHTPESKRAKQCAAGGTWVDYPEAPAEPPP